MQTTRIISNITYNTDNFFQSVVQKLVDSNRIDWCHWIRHKPDVDGEKEHIHFVLKPSKRINTDDLRKEFIEFEKGNDKPLAPTSCWRPVNSMGDWILYSLHDSEYLENKGLSRRFFYRLSDLRSTDADVLRDEWNLIDRRKYSRLRVLEDYASKRVPFFVLVQQGIVPISQRAQYEYQYEALCNAWRSWDNVEYEQETLDALFHE